MSDSPYLQVADPDSKTTRRMPLQDRLRKGNVQKKMQVVKKLCLPSAAGT